MAATSSQTVVSFDRFDKWSSLFDKGMYQLARVEVRNAAERRNPKPELAFALGMSELALRRWTQAARSFIRAMKSLEKNGADSLPPSARNLGAVLAKVRDADDLRAIPIPQTIGFWLESPNRVGLEDTTPNLSGRLPGHIKSVQFVSPMNLDSMMELERRAGTFSYDVFDLKKQEGGKPSVARAQSKHRKESKRSHTEHAPQPKNEEREKSPIHSAEWNQARPPAPPSRTAVATPITMAAPVAAAAPMFSKSVFDPTPPTKPVQPPPINPSDQWSKWENELYQLVLQGKFAEAVERANNAVDRYPASSRLREHQAYVLATSGDTGGAVRSWVETWRLANETGADDRADAAARKALSLVWEDAPQLASIARQLADTGKPAVLRSILAAAAERLLADQRLAAFESIALAMAELAFKDASSHPDAQRVVSLVERLSGEDARIVANRLKDRLRR